MSDKPQAIFTTFIIIAPLMLLCCAAPIIGISGFVAFASWMGGFDPVNAILFAVIAGPVVAGALRWKRGRSNSLSGVVKGTINE